MVCTFALIAEIAVVTDEHSNVISRLNVGFFILI